MFVLFTSYYIYHPCQSGVFPSSILISWLYPLIFHHCQIGSVCVNADVVLLQLLWSHAHELCNVANLAEHWLLALEWYG